jgi:putative endonuclease
MTTQRKKLGDHGEALAAAHLGQAGYEIIARNWRCAVGELDLIVQQAERLVFVEVRTRRGNRLGSPEESITPAKQAKLIELAHTFLADYPNPDIPWRIDVIAIVLNEQYDLIRLDHIPYAVGEA